MDQASLKRHMISPEYRKHIPDARLNMLPVQFSVCRPQWPRCGTGIDQSVIFPPVFSNLHAAPCFAPVGSNLAGK